MGIAVAREARRALAETIRQGAMPALEESNSETETDSTCEALDLSTDGDWSGTRNQNAVYPLMACCRRSPGRVSRRILQPPESLLHICYVETWMKFGFQPH